MLNINIVHVKGILSSYHHVFIIADNFRKEADACQLLLLFPMSFLYLLKY